MSNPVVGFSIPLVKAGDVLDASAKGDTGQSNFARLKLPILNTAPASAGLAKGEVWLAKATGDVYRMAMCISTAGGTARYGSRIASTTIGGGDPALSILAGDTVDASAKGTVGQTSFARIKLPILNTAPASAGLGKGEMWLSKATTDVYRMAMCISTAAGAVRYGSRIAMSTIGAGDPTLTLLAGDILNAAAKGTVGQTTFSRVRLPILNTAPASAGLTKGEVWLAKGTTDVYRMAMCISTATAATRYGVRMAHSTIGAGELTLPAGDVLNASAKGAVGQTVFARISLPILNTAPASAGLSKGDMWLAKGTTDVYRWAICISAATGAVKYGARFIRDTIGTSSS